MFQLNDLKKKMQKAQLQTENIEEDQQFYEKCFDQLLSLKTQLTKNEETALRVRLDLLSDPARLLVARLLDPHTLNYEWPFGGLVFRFTVLSEQEEEEEEGEAKCDRVFVEAARLVGAGWDGTRGCLTEAETQSGLERVCGQPADTRHLSTPPHCVLVPAYSARHAEQLFSVALPVDGENRVEYWERKNILVRIG